MNAPLGIDKRVEQYVRLRDKINEIKKRQKEELAPFNEALERLNGMLLEGLDLAGGNSIATAAGTVYRTEKRSATIADAEIFRKYVIDNEAWDLVDIKANVTATVEFIDDHQKPPPGVNYNSHYEVGVRRK